jgi:hypothetical protein
MMDHARESQVRSLTPEALLELGGPNLVYIRAVPTPSGTAWGIFAQNGQPMGVVDGRDTAFAAARQHDLEPVDVH